MSSGPAVYARAGFALGYAEDGTFPVGPDTTAACLAACEVFAETGHPDLLGLVIESGRQEGRRAALRRRRQDLYDRHKKVLAGLFAFLARGLDVDRLAADAATLAHQLATNPHTGAVDRRRRVATGVAVAVGQAATTEWRGQLADANAEGYGDAEVEGAAEAEASDGQPGPPAPSKVAEKYELLGTAGIVSRVSAAHAGAVWSDEQLSAFSMGAAMAAGDGADLHAATHAVAMALSDGSWALQVYEDQLHQALLGSYVAAALARNPGQLVYYLSCDDDRVCPICTGYEDGPDGAGSAWPAESAPEPPVHPRCRCWLELA